MSYEAFESYVSGVQTQLSKGDVNADWQEYVRLYQQDDRSLLLEAGVVQKNHAVAAGGKSDDGNAHWNAECEGELFVACAALHFAPARAAMRDTRRRDWRIADIVKLSTRSTGLLSSNGVLEVHFADELVSFEFPKLKEKELKRCDFYNCAACLLCCTFLSSVCLMTLYVPVRGSFIWKS